MPFLIATDSRGRHGGLVPAIHALATPQDVDARVKPAHDGATMTLDPVTLEVIRNALPAVANEMAVDLQRTSYNMMIYEVRDFCTALVNTQGELVAQNVGGVSHFVADLGVIIADGMKRYGTDGFAPGDVIITNHQAVAGQHLNNVVIYMPYFYRRRAPDVRHGAGALDRRGRHEHGLRRRTHRGGSLDRGSPARSAQDLRGGQAQRDALSRASSDNIRFPESSLGDMKSQMAACRLAARRMDELFDKYGRDTVLTAIAQIFDETERKCRNVVAQACGRRL